MECQEFVYLLLCPHNYRAKHESHAMTWLKCVQTPDRAKKNYATTIYIGGVFSSIHMVDSSSLMDCCQMGQGLTGPLKTYPDGLYTAQ